MWPFPSKPKVPIRPTIGDAMVRALLDLQLRGRKRADYRHIPQKGSMAVVTRADVRASANTAHRPWLKDCWECEQQALEVVQCGQKIAANEGRSWAMGILRADAPRGTDGLHVYVWAIVRDNGKNDVYFFNPTSMIEVFASELSNVDYTMT